MSDRQIVEAIQKLAGTYNADNVQMVTCTVIDTSQADRTCNVLPVSGEAVTEIDGVLLMPCVDDGWLLMPVIGSIVIVCIPLKGTPYISMFSEIDKAFLITASGIQFQGGELGGIPISQNVVDRLNILENDLNTLKAAFASWIVIPSDGGAALKAIAATWFGSTLTDTTTAQIANSSVTHGS